MQGKKFISPGAWFSMNYPSDWNEFEDGEGSFLFYNPDVWTGNFRISAFKGNATYGRDAVRQELKENESASLVKVGALESAYSKEMFQEEGNYYTSHLWITGIGNIHQLLHGDRIKRQRDLHLATVHTTLQFSQPTDTAYEIDAFIRTKIFYAQNLI